MGKIDSLKRIIKRRQQQRQREEATKKFIASVPPEAMKQRVGGKDGAKRPPPGKGKELPK